MDLKSTTSFVQKELPKKRLAKKSCNIPTPDLPRPQSHSVCLPLAAEETPNEALFRTYGTDILDNLMVQERLLGNDIGDFLKGHEVTSQLRARMVDWMIEVMTNFKCSQQAFFVAISIMDKYYKSLSHKAPVEVSELHISGVSSMLIASKYEDIYPLKLSVVYEKIAHRKIPTQDIKDYEFKILSELDFEVRAPTQYDFITIFMEHALGPEVKQDENDSELVEVLVHYVAKMVYHDYWLSQQQPSLLAAASLYVSLKLAERFKKTKKRDKLISAQFMKRLTELS